MQEDDIIVELVQKNGAKKWSVIAQNLPGRIGKQCRERLEKFLAGFASFDVALYNACKLLDVLILVTDL